MQNDLKNSIKDLYLSNKKKDKNDHSVLTDKIRREYSELYKENQNLELEIQSYERYYNDQQLDNYNNYNKRQKYIPKKYHKRKRRYKKTYNNSSSETEDGQIIVPRKKKRRQKKVYYDDNVDGGTNEAYAYYELHQHKMMTMIMKSMIMKKRMLKL